MTDESSQAAATAPSVVALVINFNGKDVTLQTLESLARLDYELLDLVVIDNGLQIGEVPQIIWPAVEARQEVRVLDGTVTDLREGMGITPLFLTRCINRLDMIAHRIRDDDKAIDRYAL